MAKSKIRNTANELKKWKEETDRKERVKEFSCFLFTLYVIPMACAIGWYSAVVFPLDLAGLLLCTLIAGINTYLAAKVFKVMTE